MHSEELLAGNGTKNVLLEHTPTWLQIWPETANKRVDNEMIVVVSIIVSKWFNELKLNNDRVGIRWCIYMICYQQIFEKDLGNIDIIQFFVPLIL